MKQELLEYIIRACAKEVLAQVNEGDPEIKGAAAPPADGQGTADQPEIPNTKEPVSKDLEQPETPDVPVSPELKGVVLISPRDKSKLQKVSLKGADDASLERELHKLAAQAAGSRVKTALSTTRLVRDAVRNPNTSVYLYIGKYDPQSNELFLMADKSLQVAKDSSVDPTEISSGVTPMAAGAFAPSLSTNVDAHLAGGGRTPTREPVNEDLKAAIKQMVNELLDSK